MFLISVGLALELLLNCLPYGFSEKAKKENQQGATHHLWTKKTLAGKKIDRQNTLDDFNKL